MLRKPTPEQTELEMVTIASLVPPDNGRPALDPVVLFKMLFIG